MLANLKKNVLVKNSLIYVTTNIISRAIPFLFLPVLTRYLSPEGYGIIATFQVLQFIVIILVSVNVHGALARIFFEVTSKELKVYIYNLFIIIFVNFLILCFILNNFTNEVSEILNFPENWLFILGVSALFEVLTSLLLNLWRVEEKPLNYGIFQIIKITVNLTLSIILVVYCNWKWQGRLISIIGTSIIFGVITIILLAKNIKFKINRKYIKDALGFGIPLIPHSLSGWLTTYIDRIFINSMVGIGDTGIYTVGYQIGNIIGIIASSFHQAWMPFLFKKLKEDKYQTKIKIVKLTYLYNIVILTLAILLSIISPIVLQYFVGEQFQSASRYVIWIALGYAANGMYYMVATYIFYAKKTHILAWVTCTSGLLNIVLNYFLIRANGAIGAAQATTITFYYTFFLVWLLSTKIYKMPWRFWRWNHETF